jgi:hypothetical protein
VFVLRLCQRLSHHSDWIARPTMVALIKVQPLLMDQSIRRSSDNKSSLVRVQPVYAILVTVSWMGVLYDSCSKCCNQTGYSCLRLYRSSSSLWRTLRLMLSRLDLSQPWRLSFCMVQSLIVRPHILCIIFFCHLAIISCRLFLCLCVSSSSAW